MDSSRGCLFLLLLGPEDIELGCKADFCELPQAETDFRPSLADDCFWPISATLCPQTEHSTSATSLENYRVIPVNYG